MTQQMMTMRATLDYLLYDWLHVDQLTGRERFSEHSRETFNAVLDLCEQIALEKFAPFNRLVDIEEPQLIDERIMLPAATGEACRSYADSGMLGAIHDYEDGGMQLPCSVDMAANSFFSAASIGLKAYSLLTAANANLLMAHGTDLQKIAFAKPQLEGRFFGTMNLSEPQAGSSLSDIITRAVSDGPDYKADPLGQRYRLTGRKMWISAGEHELGENIIHLVLAKIPGADDRPLPGIKGISLFIVPKYLVDRDAKLTGERNDVALAGLNHKLGYRGTTNTLLNYGEGRYPVRIPGGTDNKGAGAIGYLVGQPGEGLKYMFRMMNEARIQVGLGATMLGYAGYLASLDYSRQRTQGRPVASGPIVAKNPNQPPVAIIEHADVKRMLLCQKAYSEGALALQLYCAHLIDEEHTAKPDDARQARLLLELLTPIAKSWPSEWCLEANSLAIQVLGGYGYTRDFPVEQYWRDNRLNMIHEGTHGIHGLDLLGRKVLMEEGAALTLLCERMQSSVDLASGHATLAPMASQLAGVVDELMRATRSAWDTSDAPGVLANATSYLRAFGHTVLAWVWLDLACLSIAALDGNSPQESFHRGKLAAARYFFNFELPHVSGWLAVVSRCDPTCREMHPDWF